MLLPPDILERVFGFIQEHDAYGRVVGEIKAVRQQQADDRFFADHVSSFVVKKRGNDLKLDPSNQLAGWKDPTKSKNAMRKAKAKLKT